MANRKLIILSTRLPVTVGKQGGKITYSPSTGGLATGLGSVKKSHDSVWIGWPGIASDGLTGKEKSQIERELKKRGCVPVFLTKKQINEYYSGYSNATLWPLLHYFPNRARFDSRYWAQYQAVNKLFLLAAKKHMDKTATIWVHDYQLMLVPEMLRAYRPEATIGFFLHTPFPSFEIFRLIPQREELLKGLLGADLVGFHTYDYVRHFLSSVQRLVGYENELGVVRVEGRAVQADAFPIGIDYKKFAKGGLRRKITKIMNTPVFPENTKVILSAGDRLDYTKGLPSRIDAYELFLRQNPKYHGKVVMLLHAAPSRTDVQEYKELRLEIEQKISRVNGEFATVDWSPITYLYRTLPVEEIKSLFARADVMLVTPLRDGMNLVAKEFVATKHKDKGMLVLSETAGVATELTEAVMVNPNSTTDVAGAIKQALEMPEKEQRQRMETMQSRISDYNIQKWAEDFLQQLNNSQKNLQGGKKLGEKDKSRLKKDYLQADKRLVLLDYDGTLKDFVRSPQPSLSRPSRKVRTVLKKLATDDKTRVIIVSGRPKNTLDLYFEGMGLGLVAEHGGWILDAGGWVKSSLTSKKWKSLALPILRQYTARTPGSEIEEKDFSLVWHYRQVSPDLAYVRSRALMMELSQALKDTDAEVFKGSKIVEIKPKRMHKGAIVTELLSGQTWDFILAIGDDYTDEDMFDALPERAYTLRVGQKDTSARFHIESVDEVIELLTSLIPKR